MRTKKSIRNSTFALGGQLLTTILSFVTRTIFIMILGPAYLGVNGLFTSILSMLSFAELGIGTAIIYALYKPLADDDQEKISALMNLYEKVYRLIGLTVGLLGMLVIPFLENLIKDIPDNIPNLLAIYLLFLFNSVASYFFVYKRSIVIASQNSHINTTNQCIFLLLQNVAQILILLTTQNYMLYLVIQIISSITSNIFISRTVNKMFPYLNKNKHSKLDTVSKKEIAKNVIGMMSLKLGSVLVGAKDNLFISNFVGILFVGLYSNYILITSTITLIVKQFFNAVTASVGNLNASQDNKKSYFIYKILFFINFWCYGFSGIALSVMCNQFIKIWIGEAFILQYSILAIIIINFFIYGMRQTALVFIDAYGLFWQIKYKPIIEAIINISVSLFFIMVLDMGIYGVLLGTTTSTILTNVWWEPYAVYKYGFQVKLRCYFERYAIYVMVVAINFLITDWLCELPRLTGITDLVYRLIICLGVTNGVFFLAFHKTEEYKYLITILKTFVIKPLHRKNTYQKVE